MRQNMPMTEKRSQPKEPLSNTSIGLFIVLFAANLMALLPAIATPISALLREADATPFFAPAALYAVVVAAALFFLSKRRGKRSRWAFWVGAPAVGLALCLISMFFPLFAIVLAIYAGVNLLAQVIVMSFFGGEQTLT